MLSPINSLLFYVQFGFFLLPRRTNPLFLASVLRYQPMCPEAYRFLKKGLKITGESVYDFGAAAENMTAEATEVFLAFFLQLEGIVSLSRPHAWARMSRESSARVRLA